MTDLPMEGTTKVQDNMRITWNAGIPVRDGSVLRCDIYAPVEEGRYPAIVTISPYTKAEWVVERFNRLGAPSGENWDSMAKRWPALNEDSSNKYKTVENPDPEHWVPNGYVQVRVDARGSGWSAGVMDPWSEQEAQDTYDAIEWIAQQPWSNGKVGMLGVSYYAVSQWRVAELNPPHLAAIIPWEGLNDVYRDNFRVGGIMGDFALGWERGSSITQYGRGDFWCRSHVTGEPACAPGLTEEDFARNRAPMTSEVVQHEMINTTDYYAKHTPDLSKVRVPLLTIGNYANDLHLRGSVAGFTDSASDEKWIRFLEGPSWQGATLWDRDSRKVQLAFFDHYLKGIDNGWEKNDPVHLMIRHADGTRTARDEKEWPLARTQWTKFYLSAAMNKCIMSKVPIEAPGKVTYQAKGDFATFTYRLEEDTELTGPMAAKLFISSSTTDTDLFLAVRAFTPEGREITFQGAQSPYFPIAVGMLRASHRKLDEEKTLPYRPYHTHDEKQPLVPGEIYEVDVEIWPSNIVLPKGSVVALSVGGHDWEYDGAPIEGRFVRVDNARGKGTCCPHYLENVPECHNSVVTVYTGGEYGSYLMLPVIPEK